MLPYTLNLYYDYFINMTLRILISIIAFLIGTHLALSQTKKEKEERINLSEFPSKAQNVLSKFPKDCKRIKFFKETDGNKQSFEAKFKYNEHRYSLEFSSEGIIEDLELCVKLNAIEDSSQDQIKEHFKSSYLKYKLIKIQKQFVFNQNLDSDTFVAQVLYQESTDIINYEIIAEVKTKDGRELREFTFNHKGFFINFRVVEPSSYEHVLY